MGVSDSDFDDRIRLTRPSPQAGANRRVSCTAARGSLDKNQSMFDKAFVRSVEVALREKERTVRTFSVDKERGDRQ